MSLHVHKHLLLERSKLLKDEVEAITEGYLDWTVYMFLDLTAASKYLGFLYGNPMWVNTPGSDIGEAWDSLEAIHSLSMEYEDFDAADACLDGMREVLEYRHGDFGCPFAYGQMDLNTPRGRLILDYMVYRSFDIREWIDAYNSCQGEHNLEEALSKTFAEAAQRKKEKIGKPDLMERCRYHLHVEKGLPCYLDK